MKDDGGSAFPEIETDNRYDRDLDANIGHTYSYGGMSLRDYFAAQSLAIAFGKEGSSIPLSDMAKYCYQMADAMLAERLK